MKDNKTENDDNAGILHIIWHDINSKNGYVIVIQQAKEDSSKLVLKKTN